MVHNIRQQGIAKKNWGDSLNFYIFHKLSDADKKTIKLHKASIAGKHYIICGSVIRLANDSSIIWGAGFISDNDSILNRWGPFEPNKALYKPTVICVRGPLTRNKLINYGVNCPDVYGDPALIFPFFYNPIHIKKKYKYGIIPHYIDKTNPNLQPLKSNKDIKFIDICLDNKNNLLKIINDISECDVVFSSTLHGLILGDLYSKSKKSFYVILSNKLDGGDFKFKDYMLSINRPFVKLNIKDVIKYVKTDGSLQKNDFYNYTKTFDFEKLLLSCPFIDDKVKILGIEFFKKYNFNQ